MVALLLGVVVLPAARAAVPSPANKTIVFGRSIGAVKLGMPFDDAKTIWGTADTCATTEATRVPKNYCRWVNSEDGGSLTITAASTAAGAKVAEITLIVGINPDSGAPVYTGAGLAFKTKDGFGIGAKEKALKKAYPKVKDEFSNTLVLKAAKSVTHFSRFKGRITQVDIVVR